jgi:predicted Rossmann fold flavoprotein
MLCDTLNTIFYLKEYYMKLYSAAIIGGGASGMMCAVNLIKHNITDIVIFERNDRLGKKLSASGNGQGNITNINLSDKNYFSFSHLKSENLKYISDFGNKSVINFFEDLGGVFLTDERGRVYPASMQASSLTDLLRFYIEKSKTEVKLNCKITDIENKDNIFIITDESGNQYQSKNVVLCAGGKAAKNYGTDGNGYFIAKKLGHSVTDLYPSIVQLKTEQNNIKGLKGIRADCIVKALNGKTEIYKTRGDLLFTDYGVSGNAVFQLSSYVANRQNSTLSIEFLPDITKEKLEKALYEKTENYPQLSASEIFCCIINNQIGRTVIKYSNIAPSAKCGEIKDKIKEIVYNLKHFELKITGSLDFDYAQVTKGGIKLEEIENLESKMYKNLYFAGEILDIDGECGDIIFNGRFQAEKQLQTK